MQIIHTHFWLKRQEICNQIQDWITELSKPQHSRQISLNSMVLRRQYRQLREELAKLPVPEGLEDLDRPFAATVSSPTAAGSDTASNMSATFSLTPGGSVGGGGDGGGVGSTSTSGGTTVTSTSSVGMHEENSSSSDSTIPSIQIDSNDPLIISINDIL